MLVTNIYNLVDTAFVGKLGNRDTEGASETASTGFFMSLLLGVGQGFQPVSGFNYGAGKYSRVRKSYRFTLALAEILMVVLGIVAFTNAPQFIYLFREDADVVGIGTRALRLQSLAGMVMPVCVISEMLLQTVGADAFFIYLSFQGF